MINLILLGATGSIGSSVLKIIDKYPLSFNLVGISFFKNLEKGMMIVNKYKPKLISVSNDFNENILYEHKLFKGSSGLVNIVKEKIEGKVIVINALVSSNGLLPTIEAIKNGYDIALANKESLVMAGKIIMDLAREYNVSIYPVDSEHSTIYQIIKDKNKDRIKKLIITASGGSLYNYSQKDLKNIKIKDVLNHPTWSMGKKITVDSATMMNKGFEVIEAHYLFGIDIDKIETIIHRESLVHSLVEFDDGNIFSIISKNTMEIPILKSIDLNNNLKYESNFSLFDKTLTFKKMDLERFKSLKYAYDSLKKGGVYPCVLLSANDAAVELFLDGIIEFIEIEKLIFEYINKDYSNFKYNIDNLLELNKLIKDEIYEKYKK